MRTLEKFNAFQEFKCSNVDLRGTKENKEKESSISGETS
ncbi:CLUMA_CG013868, isoform A, partial [Clunio marinus]